MVIIIATNATFGFAQLDAPVIQEGEPINGEKGKKVVQDKKTDDVQEIKVKEKGLIDEEKKAKYSMREQEVLIIPKPDKKLRLTRTDDDKIPSTPDKEN